jgi:NTE family protein
MDKPNISEYRHIVFEGASVKIFAYIGVIKALEEHGILKNLTHYIGTSSGSIIATMLALDYTSSEIRDLFYAQNEKTLGLAKPNYIYFIYNLLYKYGYINNGMYLSFIKSIIKAKSTSKSEDYTFKELYDNTGKVLVITGTCLNKRETHYYNHIANPNMPIWKAIQISSALPLAFPCIKWKSDILIDGCVLENYPLYYIDANGKFPNSRHCKVVFNYHSSSVPKNTLGVKLLTLTEDREDSEIFHGNDPIENFKEFLISIFNTMFTQIVRDDISPGYWTQSIVINVPKNIDNYNFNITEKDKDLLYNNGYIGTNLFLGHL